ncbi:Uncharacterized protein OBRU01_08623 [Operophtera brumata]|uniref:Uncharacterized protein n=1 Tax=Operophtera brumata TaxID=104452 RepID=A0A0L7LH62_OPEBR|nr:Uncharacterized protein OBRU01_08623 [Operophtera brumata]
MAIGVDTSKWKPRKLKGTPAAKFRNWLAYGIIGGGMLCGLVFHFAKTTEGLRKAVDVFYEDPIEEVERRLMIASGLPNRTSATIRREESAAQTVSSKYFTNSAMDDSLIDFQEPKKLAGPKNAAKAKPDKPKKAPKRIRGQKDIRTALRSKKNELESYAKDFDNVCKHAGLDVDSEQLQIAIALSKSLQQTESRSGNNSEISQSLTSQDRVGKIRTTLLEYGFKVPEIKIKTTTRRLKKRNKYKLLLTSEAVKKQIITDKYSRVLFENITLSKGSENTAVDFTNITLYNLATNASYSILKNLCNFYVENLFEKSTSTGNLLRDWSEIPGRPVSPKLCEPTSMDFSEIECSQDELDIVLSGSLKSYNFLMKSKEKEIVRSHKFIEQKEVVSNNLHKSPIFLIDDENLKPNDNDSEILKPEENQTTNKEELKNNETLKPKEGEIIGSGDAFLTVNQYRSCSPDLFDDEPSTVVDTTKTLLSQERELPSERLPNAVSANNNDMDLTECGKGGNLRAAHSIHSNPYSQQLQNTDNSKKYPDFMEITECVEVQCLGTNSTNIALTSQNITKRKSNDFMEITKCVASTVQTLPIECDIDLTQSPESKNTNIVLSEPNKTYNQNHVGDDQTNIDTNIENDNYAVKHLGCDKILKTLAVVEKNDIDLTESPEAIYNNATRENMPDKSIASVDLTQSSNTSDDLPFVSLKTNLRNGKENNQPADITIIIDPKDYERMNKYAELQDDDEILDLTQNILHGENNHGLQGALNNGIEIESTQAQNAIGLDLTQNKQHADEILDLTQEIVITSRHNSKTNSETDVSLFEEYVRNHSDNNDVHEKIKCDNNFDKVSNKETLNVGEDTSSKDVSPEVVFSQSPNKINSKHDESGGIDLTQNLKSSEGRNQDLQNMNSARSKVYRIETEADFETTIEMEIGESPQNDIDFKQHFDSKELSQELGSIKSKNHSINLDSDNDSDATVEIEIGKVYQSDINLTQNSESEEFSQDIRNKGSKDQIEADSDSTIEMEIIKSSQRCSSLGKKDDVSIDYDNLYDNLVNKHSYSQQKRSLSKSGDHNTSNVSNNSNDPSNCSQNSEVFVISDNELDYSMHQSELEKPLDNFLFGGLSIMDDLSGLASFRRSTNIQNTSAATDKNVEATVNLVDVEDYNQIENATTTPVKHKRVNDLTTPQKPSCSGLNTVVTPSNPLQLLTHIYNQTHPTVEPYPDEESPCKRRRTNNFDSPQKQSPIKLPTRKILSPKKPAKSPRKVPENKKSPTKLINTKERAQASKESNERLNGEDLLKFMDKKCITVKTTDNDARNHNR